MDMHGYGILFNVGEPLALGATILGAHQKKKKEKKEKKTKNRNIGYKGKK